MGRPILHNPRRNHKVQSRRRTPEQIGANVVIFGFFQHFRSLFDQCLNNRQSPPVLQGGIDVVRCVLFHHMNESVRNSVDRLAFGQGKSRTGINDRKFRKYGRNAAAEFFLCFPSGNDQIAIHFRPRRRQGDHRTDGHFLRQRYQAFHNLPFIAVIPRRHGYELRRIQNGTASDGQNEIDILRIDNLHGLQARFIFRIRLDSRKFDDFKTFQRLFHLIVNAVLFYRPASVCHQNLFSRGYQSGQL